MISEALKIIRRFNGSNISTVAEFSGFSKSYISEIESGKKKVNDEILTVYSNLFKVSKSDIYLISETLENKIDKKRAVASSILRWIASE